MKIVCKTWSLVLFGMIYLVFTQTACQSEPFKQGKILYTNFCANCHMDDGSGLEGIYPPLANADYIAEDPLKMVCIIRNGMEGEIVVNGKTYNQPMEGIPQLTEFEISNIINYINQAWGNEYGFVKMGNIRTQLENCE